MAIEEAVPGQVHRALMETNVEPILKWINKHHLRNKFLRVKDLGGKWENHSFQGGKKTCLGGRTGRPSNTTVMPSTVRRPTKMSVATSADKRTERREHSKCVETSKSPVGD